MKTRWDRRLPHRARIALAAVSLLGSGFPAACSGRPAATTRIRVDRLITGLDRFSGALEFSTAVNGYFGNPFLLRDYGERYAHLNEAKSTQSRELRELAGYGVEALPALLAHVTDQRFTRVSSGFPNAGNAGTEYGDEYDYRYRDPKRQPGGVNTGLAERGVHFVGPAHQLRVGDLCYEVIGQIVNRHLHPVVARPGILVNSPVLQPAIAAAVRRDWSGLTRANHRRALEDDALYDNRYVWRSIPDALERLTYYYPAEAESLALRLLALPLVDASATRDFVDHELLTTPDATRWKPLLRHFEKQHGRAQTVEAIRYLCIHFASNPTRNEDGGPTSEDRERARALLARVFPWVDPYRPPAPRSIEVFHLADVIAGVSGLRSAKVDQAVLRAFRETAALVRRGESVEGADGVAISAAERLGGLDWDEEFAGYFYTRIEELEKNSRGSVERANELRRELRRLEQRRRLSLLPGELFSHGSPAR